MPIYQRGTTWLVSVGSKQGRYRKSFKTYADAVLAEKKQLLIQEGVIEAPNRPQETTLQGRQGVGSLKTLKDAYDLTVRDVWSQNKGDSQTRCGKYVLNSLGESTPISTISTSLIREMVEEFEDGGNAGSTVNGKLSALSMMLKTAADEGWIEAMPRMKRRSPGTHRIRWLDQNEELAVLNTCTRLGLLDLRDFVIVAMDTGFRRMELLKFQSREYRNGMLNLHPDETKTSKARSVPATDRVDEILRRRHNHSYVFSSLSVTTLRNQWEKVRAELGMSEDPQFVIHMLRHTCASRLAMQDKTAQFIQAWMGHATPLTTARYMHLAPGKLKEGKEALEDYRRQQVSQLKSA